MGNWRNLFILILFLISSLVDAQSPKSNNIHPDIIVVKLKSEKSPNSRIAFSASDKINQIKELVDIETAYQVFPKKSLTNARSSSSGLENIYKIKLFPGTDIWRTISRIEKSGLVEYVEPLYEDELLYIPNDPEAQPNTGKQDYLEVIKAYQAWDIERSDTSMVIGIVDTGVKMDHEDLQNIAFNYADPINGVDDDSDGYIDNYYGWDISDEDNDPTADGHPHGSPVTGLSSASTNNNTGMAGIGFNARYLPVKIAQTSSQKLYRSYEGIRYAADHGAKVINLSWGGAGNYSRYGQDIINYAVLEKDAVVVAAAGNTNEELDFYPASFQHVLSVGATDINDNKASWATYSHYIDLMAPGDDVFTTKNNGGYEITWGSSFSSPLVAGAAALVRSRFPELDAIQVMEQLRVTADDIYDIGNNRNYDGKLGKGRLNVQRALSDILTPSVRLSEFKYEGNHGQLVFAGDTVKVVLEFTNYLRTAENLTISTSCVTGNAVLQSEDIYISSMETFQTVSNEEQPIIFVVNENAQPGDRLFFRIDYLGNYYEDFEYFEIPITPEFFDITDGNLTATITSDGDIGFDDSNFRNGNGILFDNEVNSINAGFLLSQDKDHVIDNVINDFSEFTRDQDFMAESSIKLYYNSVADYDARSVFKPHDTIPSALPIRIEQKVLGWENPPENGYLIFEYRIINTGDSTLSGLNAGIFADWDLGDYQNNGAATDESQKMGYVFDKLSNNQYAGLALLTDHSCSHYAIDLMGLNGNSADFDTVFTDSIKHAMLNPAIPKNDAGIQGDGNNVAQILGAKQFELQPNGATKIAIAMLASSNLDGLKSALNSAEEKYALYQQNPPTGQNFYACLGDSAVIDPVGETYEFYQDLELTNRLDSGMIYRTPPVLQDTFYYAVNLDSGYRSNVIKINVKPGNPTADFNLLPDTLLIESGTTGILKTENISFLASKWNWDFGNGYHSSVEHPFTQYNNPGNYSIQLIASNEYGCIDTTSRELLVAIRPEKPIVDNKVICKHTATSVSASNTNHIKVYKDPDLSNLIYSGEVFETGIIQTDTIFYVTNTNGAFKSLAVPVEISVKYPATGIDFEMDTTDLENKYALTIQNSFGPIDSLFWHIDDQLVSRDSVFNHLYDENVFKIQQVKIDAGGCTDTLSLMVEPGFSNMPNAMNMEVCAKNSFIIQPEEGELFHFYADQQLTQLLHKGRSYQVQGIDEATSYYVSNVGQLLESASATIDVSVNPVKAVISVSSDSIPLEEAFNIKITNSSEHANASFWLYPSGTFDTTTVLSENYEKPGNYSYELVALGSNGCSDTTNQKITVYSITGMDDIKGQDIRIFPNPTTSEFTIDLGKELDQQIWFELINSSGQSIERFAIPKNHSLFQHNLDEHPNGLYLIRPIAEKTNMIYKILKE